MAFAVASVSRRLQAVGVALGLCLLWTCAFSVDPDEGRFTCADDGECGGGFVCRPQKAQDYGLCHPAGACADTDVCDGADEDCDGVVDDDEPESHGPCDAAGEVGRCAHGQERCVQGAVACVPGLPAAEACNGEDDDCDGFTDEDFALSSDDAHCGACGVACAAGGGCVDSACRELSCDDGVDNDGDGGTDCSDPWCRGQACGADAGLNCGRVPQAGVDGGVPGCVAREGNCTNAVDDDGDGEADCGDPDCDGKPCSGGTCVGRTCR